MSEAVSAEMLLGWLDHDPDRLERHLADHPEDTDRLDLLTALPELKAWLSEALVVPVDLAERIRSLVQGDPARREAGRVLAELLGTSWRTASLLWTDEELS
jgi:hypothetical protein